MCRSGRASPRERHASPISMRVVETVLAVAAGVADLMEVVVTVVAVRDTHVIVVRAAMTEGRPAIVVMGAVANGVRSIRTSASNGRMIPEHIRMVVPPEAHVPRATMETSTMPQRRSSHVSCPSSRH